MAETGMQTLFIEAALARVAYDLARDILDLHKDPIQYAQHFERLWIQADSTSAIADLGQMPDTIYVALTYSNKNEQEIRRDLRDELIAFTRSYEAKHFL